MKSSAKKVELAPYDDLFSTEESRQDAKLEKIREIPLSELHPFKNHPFKVKDDEAMMETADSVRQYGVLVPAIARPDPEGGYELVAGHRRHRASELAEKETMPVIVRDLDDDAATIIMVDSNLQRESLLPSERAFAYKMKLEAMKHQGARGDLTSSQLGTKLRADELLAQQAGSSRNQVQRYIRLTELIPELLDTAEQLFYRFNNEHPADYRHPSMSVSDIVAIKRDGKVSCHYCDSFGFAEVPGFLPDNPLKNAEMAVEDDYGMIDGILNNGQRQPPQRELPEKRKSVVEQLKSQPKPEHKKTAPKKSAEREI